MENRVLLQTKTHCYYRGNRVALCEGSQLWTLKKTFFNILDVYMTKSPIVSFIASEEK